MQSDILIFHFIFSTLFYSYKLHSEPLIGVNLRIWESVSQHVFENYVNVPWSFLNFYENASFIPSIAVCIYSGTAPS